MLHTGQFSDDGNSLWRLMGRYYDAADDDDSDGGDDSMFSWRMAVCEAKLGTFLLQKRKTRKKNSTPVRYWSCCVVAALLLWLLLLLWRVSANVYVVAFLEIRRQGLDAYMKSIIPVRPALWSSKTALPPFTLFLAPAQWGDQKPAGKPHYHPPHQIDAVSRVFFCLFI